MRSELVEALVVVTLDSRIFRRAVHPLSLSVGPRVIGFCQTVLDAVLTAEAIEQVHAETGCRAGTVTRRMAEPHPVVGQYRVDLVGRGLD